MDEIVRSDHRGSIQQRMHFLVSSIFVSLFVTGCASVSDSLTRNVEQSIEVAQYCTALASTFPVEEDELRSRLANVIRSRAIGQFCAPIQDRNSTAAILISTASVSAPKACDNSIIDEYLITVRDRLSTAEKSIATEDERFRSILKRGNDAMAIFRTSYEQSAREVAVEIDSALDGVQGLKACHGLACGRKVEIALMANLGRIDKALLAISADAEKLRSTMASLRVEASSKAEIQEIYGAGALAASAASAIVEEGRKILQDLLKDAYVQAALRQYLVSRELYKVGGRIMTAIDRGVEPADALVEKIDQKAWFAGTLAIVFEERKINDAMDSLSQRLFDPKRSELLVRAAFARAACDRWLGSGAVELPGRDAAAKSSLISPFLYRLFMQVKADIVKELERQAVVPRNDFAKDLVLTSVVVNGQTSALTNSLLPADMQAVQVSRMTMERLVDVRGEDVARFAFRIEEKANVEMATSQTLADAPIANRKVQDTWSLSSSVLNPGSKKRFAADALKGRKGSVAAAGKKPTTEDLENERMRAGSVVSVMDSQKDLLHAGRSGTSGADLAKRLQIEDSTYGRIREAAKNESELSFRRQLGIQ